MKDPAANLDLWRERALHAESEIAKAVVGQQRAIRLMITAIFSRGHALLEGDVGVGKTTLLRAVTRVLGGAYERIEGTVDLLPNDLIYYTYVGEDGRPRVEPGPLLRHGEGLSTFFFNEINRARPQVHSLLLRAMAERSVSAFNRDYHFPHLQVFADRNRVEREETFEIPSAARDRFMMEIAIETPQDPEIRRALAFDPAFHDVDALLGRIESDVIPYAELNAVASTIQHAVQDSPALRTYGLDLWTATHDPSRFGVKVPGVDMGNLILAGASPRGIAMLMRAARVGAWLAGRDYLTPEDLQTVFFECMAHRVFFNPVYEMRRARIARDLVGAILGQIAAP